jgi:hypothetical protein
MRAPIVQVDRLDELEAVIARGLDTFVQVGGALMEIRELRLYRHRDGFSSFEQYCRERWNMDRLKADRLIDAARISRALPPNGGSVPIPNEAVARELAPLKRQPEKLRETWATITRANPRPTARDVRAFVRGTVSRPVMESRAAAAAEIAPGDAVRALAAVSAACILLAGMKPPAELIAALPFSVRDYPTKNFALARDWLRDFLDGIQ